MNVDSSTEAEGAGSRTSRAVARLRSDIMSGVLPPGQKLKIEELRQGYEIGTTPLREALSLLVAEHFVERIDQRGFRVAQVSAAEFDELLKTRCWLEERALRESIARGDRTWEESVVLANYRLSRIPRSQSADHFVANTEWEAAHKRFHMALIAQCGSAILLKFCDQLYEQNIRYRQLSGTTAYPARDVAEEHNAICDAVLARDADAACERLIVHYRNTSGYVAREFGDQAADSTKSKSTV